MKLSWDNIGERTYETGVEQAVLYVQSATGTYPLGVAWNGLTSVSESPSGAEPTPLYADNTQYLNMTSAEKYAATYEAYTYPDEFAECDGSLEIAPGIFAGQQNRKTFGTCYKTLLGNDTEGTDHGYKLHLMYGGLAAPSSKDYATVNDSPEAITFSWEVSTTPVNVTTKFDGKKVKPMASIVIDSTKVDADDLADLEEILYGKNPTTSGGDDGVDSRLPLPDEIFTLFGTTQVG